MESTPTTPIPTPDQLRAIQALRVIVANNDPVVFRASRETPSREFYWITVHYLVADISVLVSNACQFPLDQGRFRHSIKEILARLQELGVSITNYRIVEDDDENQINTPIP